MGADHNRGGGAGDKERVAKGREGGARRPGESWQGQEGRRQRDSVYKWQGLGVEGPELPTVHKQGAQRETHIGLAAGLWGPGALCTLGFESFTD